MTRVILFCLGAVIAAAQARTPVVVELFTSEGCSSCPPADALLMRLQRAVPEVEVIPLGEHVDYWNHDGWTDRFSSPLFSARQQDYGRTFRLESVFTPQMVVNGQAQFIGSDEARAIAEIRKAARGPKAALQIAMRPGDLVHLAAGQIPGGTRNVDMFLAITESGLETMPAGGENGGLRLRHTGVVRNLTSIGHFDAQKSASYVADAKVTLNPRWAPNRLTLVWFAQDRATRKILGAATARP